MDVRASTPNAVSEKVWLGAGATFTIGANGNVHFSVPGLLLYPFLVMFLAIGWSTQYATIRDMGTFCSGLERAGLGAQAPSLGWETMLRQHTTDRRSSHMVRSGWQDAKGIFLGIEILALALAVGRSGFRLDAGLEFFRHPQNVQPYL